MGKKKQAVSASSAMYKELLSLPGPLAKESFYTAENEKQPCAKKHREIIANEERQINQQAVNKPKECMQDSMQIISMTELYDMVCPPRIPVIDDLLYSGTYLFAGAPKIGKSFFMAQLAYHVAKGVPLWNYPVHKGTVLYLALEDDYARLQQRLSHMFGVDSADNLYFATRAKKLDEGLSRELESFVKEHGNAKLIIIDTLQKVRDYVGDRFSYASDYDIVTKLKKFSDMHNICLLVVHHTRKLESADSFDMISGTNGLLGAADGAFVIQKEKRTENKATLEIAGRDQQEQRLLLGFNRERCVWELVKAETELWEEPIDPVLELVSEFIDSRKKWSGTATELLKHLPELNLQPNMLTRKLNISKGKLYMDYHISYDCSRGHEGRKIVLKRQEEESEQGGCSDDEKGTVQTDI